MLLALGLGSTVMQLPHLLVPGLLVVACTLKAADVCPIVIGCAARNICWLASQTVSDAVLAFRPHATTRCLYRLHRGTAKLVETT